MKSDILEMCTELLDYLEDLDHYVYGEYIQTEELLELHNLVYNLTQDLVQFIRKEIKIK